MFEAGIGTIIWFIIKVIVSILIVFYGGLFLIGLIGLMIRRSGGSVLKMLFKVLIILIVGGVTAFYLMELVHHLFSNGEGVATGGVGGVILLILHLLSKIVGSLYAAASLVAFIVWISFIYYASCFLFRASNP